MKKDVLELMPESAEEYRKYIEKFERYFLKQWNIGSLSEALDLLKSKIGDKDFFNCVPLSFIKISNKDYVLDVLKSNHYFKDLAKFIVDNKDEIL